MDVPQTNPAVPSPPTPASTRGSQYAAGALVAVCLLLLGFRWVNDRMGPRPTEIKQAAHQIELNTASRSELLQLPGIGATRADKILAYRSANGGFQRLEDLRSVNGIGDITLQRVKPFIHVDAIEETPDEPLRLNRKPTELTTEKATKTAGAKTESPAKTAGAKKPAPDAPIDLNKASLADLQRLPGVGPTLAQRIVERRERQPFTKVEDLRTVGGIGVKKLDQIRPFVTVGAE
jgi:competence protein ComEA